LLTLAKEQEMPDSNVPRRLPLLGLVKDAEKQFLSGRRDRGRDLESAVRYFLEFLHGFEELEFDRPCVTVFGSARFAEDHAYYGLAREVGRRLAEEGYAVMTGGGPGIMEAANRGAHEAGGTSFGCNIRLPKEQDPNPYLDRYILFDHFFVRKLMLVKYSCAFVVMPGGFGTLDEAFEVATLVQTGKLESFPIVTMCAEFWQKMREFIVTTLIPAGTLSPPDAELIYLTDSVDEALQRIRGRC
jgi:uncharacterized protein (TIGR00730 family)